MNFPVSMLVRVHLNPHDKCLWQWLSSGKLCDRALLCSSLTSQRAGVPEGPDLRVGEAGEQRDHRVHHVLVVDDAVLALPDQHPDELAEVGAELLPLRPRHGQGIITTVLQNNRRKRSSIKGLPV